MEDHKEATLCYELEEIIFKETVHLFPSSAPRLMLVSHRVHQLIGNIVYGICQQIVQESIFPDTERPGAPSIPYFGQFVKHLIMGGPMESDRLKFFLGSCPDLIDLALWTGYPTKDLLPLLANHNLQRLSTNLCSLDESDFLGPSLRSITHLDVTIFGEELERWKAFKYLPALTHLAINDPIDTKIVEYLLDHCLTLRILLAIQDSDSEESKNPKLTDAKIYDPRFVMMDVPRLTVWEWLNGANGEEDFWTCAEKISAAKRYGSFSKENFCTWFSRYEWRDELEALEKEYLSS